jgi:hypothetical protein
MTGSKTMFGDFRRAASAVYRVTTESSVYLVGFHEERGRRFVVVRGLPGTDREHVVIRDSEPRIGDASMFTLAPAAWIGKLMEVATMTSSAVTAVEPETDRAAISSVGGDSASARSAWPRPHEPTAGWAPRPLGMPEQPGIVPGFGRGTTPDASAAGTGVGPAIAPRGVAHQLVVGQSQATTTVPPAPEVPYPQRQILYAENAAAFLRAVARRDRLFDDLAGEPELRTRLHKALDDCAELLEQIRRRGRR